MCYWWTRIWNLLTWFDVLLLRFCFMACIDVPNVQTNVFKKTKNNRFTRSVEISASHLPLQSRNKTVILWIRQATLNSTLVKNSAQNFMSFVSDELPSCLSISWLALDNLHIRASLFAARASASLDVVVGNNTIEAAATCRSSYPPALWILHPQPPTPFIHLPLFSLSRPPHFPCYSGLC